MSVPDRVIASERDGDIAIVRIARPQTKNSLTVEQVVELGQVIETVARSDARCLMLTGANGCFCAGRDLRAVDPDQEDTHRMMITTIHPLLRQLRTFPVPTIAAVAGPALGLGLGLALSCDVVLAAEEAKFGSPFRNFGGVMDSGGHYFLERGIGRHRALELIFTGRLLDGREAAAIGLVNRVLAATELERESMELCRHIAAGPTAAFGMSKHILAQRRDFEEVIELEARSIDAALKSPDGREGLSAYKERRAPRFTGK